MKIEVYKGLQGISLYIPFEGKPTLENIKNNFPNDKAILEDVAGEILDQSRNDYVYDKIYDAVLTMDCTKLADYLIDVKENDTFTSNFGIQYVLCFFDARRLIKDLLGEDILNEMEDYRRDPYF